jgi:hypothetical protein
MYPTIRSETCDLDVNMRQVFPSTVCMNRAKCSEYHCITVLAVFLQLMLLVDNY